MPPALALHLSSPAQRPTPNATALRPCLATLRLRGQAPLGVDGICEPHGIDHLLPKATPSHVHLYSQIPPPISFPLRRYNAMATKEELEFLRAQPRDVPKCKEAVVTIHEKVIQRIEKGFPRRPHLTIGLLLFAH